MANKKEPELHGIFFKPPIFTVYLGNQMAEVFKAIVYGEFVQGKKDLTILDVGANIGVTSYYFHHFAKMIYALEPAEEHFKALSEMVRYNKLKNITPINKALYIRDGKQPFYLHSNRTAYSLTDIDGKTPAAIVDCLTLEQLFDEYKIDKVDLMKLDIEGNEYDIICSTGFKNVSKKIKSIVFETHTWAGRNPNQIKDALAKNGYEMRDVDSGADSKLFCATRHDI